MRETEAELDELQQLLDRSAELAGPHLRGIFRPPERSLSARQVAALFGDRTKQVAVATVTPRGEPRVAPVDALLLRGRIVFGTSIEARRAHHLRRNPAVSLAYFEGEDVAILVHGRVVTLEFGTPEFSEVDGEWVRIYGGEPSKEGSGVVFYKVEPTSMFTFARYPERFPG